MRQYATLCHLSGKSSEHGPEAEVDGGGRGGGDCGVVLLVLLSYLSFEYLFHIDFFYFIFFFMGIDLILIR